MKIKVNDLVRVLTGKDKGKQGKVTQVFPKRDLVVIDGVRQSVRHIGGKNAKTRGVEGQRVTYFAPIHVSNVALVTEGKK
jgi:large subunit ribosomal protein L24